MVSKWCCVIRSFLNNCWMFCDFGLFFVFTMYLLCGKGLDVWDTFYFFGDLKLLNDFVWWSGFWIMSACPLKDFNMFFCAIVKWFLNEYVWWMVFDWFFYDFVWLLICFVWFLCDGVVSEWLLKYFLWCLLNFCRVFQQFVWFCVMEWFWIMFESFLNDFWIRLRDGMVLNGFWIICVWWNCIRLEWTLNGFVFLENLENVQQWEK